MSALVSMEQQLLGAPNGAGATTWMWALLSTGASNTTLVVAWSNALFPVLLRSNAILYIRKLPRYDGAIGSISHIWVKEKGTDATATLTVPEPKTATVRRSARSVVHWHAALPESARKPSKQLACMHCTELSWKP